MGGRLRWHSERQIHVVYGDGTSSALALNRQGHLVTTGDELGTRTYSYHVRGAQTNVTNISNAFGTESASMFDNEDRATTVTNANGVVVTH